MNEKVLQTVAMEEIWKSQSDGYIPALLEIYNPDIKWSDQSLGQENCYLRVISDTNAVMYKGKRYLPCRFTFTMPEEDGKKVGDAAVTISSIDSRIPYMLRSIELQCEVSVNAFFAKQTVTGQDGEEHTVIRFLPLDSVKTVLPSATYNRSTANFRLVFKDVLQINIPAEVATQDRLPSVNENA